MRTFKHLVTVIVLVLVAGCAGGSCSNGCSCSGFKPLANGFEPEHKIENAGALRLTDEGIGWLDTNLVGLAGKFLGDSIARGVMTVDVPPTSGSFSGVQFTACENGPEPDANPPECIADIDFAAADLAVSTQPEHSIVISGPLPIRLQKLPLEVTYFCLPGGLGCATSTIDVTLNGNDSCPGAEQLYANIDLTVDIALAIDDDPSHPRHGYTRADIKVDLDRDQLNDALHFCGGFDAGILEALKGIAGDLLIDSVVGTIDEQAEQALCVRADPNAAQACPNGTSEVAGICRYGTEPTDQCASAVLGVEGNLDMAALLASMSPGTTGAMDLLFAVGGHSLRSDGTTGAWGDLNPTAGGATLGMYGGSLAKARSACVSAVELSRPANIPIPDELLENAVPGWPSNFEGPHLGFSMSERFANYALAEVYNSGALCLGLTAETLGGGVPLNTKVLALGLGGADSLEEIGRMKDPAELAIMVVPQEPPTVTFGNGTDASSDPLLNIGLKQLSLDFYAWSSDRFIRVMTVTLDAQVPVNLMVGPDGLTPVIPDIVLSNTVITNAPLLREDPKALAAGLEELLGGLLGPMLGDGFSAIDYNAQFAGMGVELSIPPSVEGKGSPGLRKLVKGSDNFLALFGSFSLLPDDPTPQALPAGVSPSTTRASVEEVVLSDDGPRAIVAFGSDLDNGMQTIEWQVRLDGGPWRPFTRDRELVLQDAILRLPGRHSLAVRSRVVGQPLSLDRVPVQLEILIDQHAPQLKFVLNSAGDVRVLAADEVSPERHTELRVRLGNDDGDDVAWQPWSTWMPADQIAAFDPQDADYLGAEARDESGNVGQLQQPLIRGQGDPTAEGCSCKAGPRPGNPVPGLTLVALFGGLLLMRNRRRWFSNMLLNMKGLPLLALLLIFGSAPGCSCGEEDATGPSGCAEMGNCQPFESGLVGAYTSAAVADDGTIWVAGYLEADWENERPYGDLVVGRLQDGSVAWATVDGVPSEPAVDGTLFDRNGLRGGQTEPGDDVGLWTSLALTDANMPAVAYFDVTHQALKFAQLGSKGWTVSTVQELEHGSVGRYAKLLFVKGKPVIASMFVEAKAEQTRSGIRLATASSAAGDSWTFSDVLLNEATPCSPALCSGGTSCTMEANYCLSKTKDCSADCADGEACVSLAGKSQCAIVRADDRTTYPLAAGLYVSLKAASDGSLGLLSYDRVNRELRAAKQVAGKWQSVVVAGGAGIDAGIGASLAIDKAGDFHVAYVDGTAEALHYVRVSSSLEVTSPELVDDGLSFGDGRHLVGDDANVSVNSSGEVRIAYQDTTAGKLRYAVRAKDGSWTARSLKQSGFAGAFPVQLATKEGDKILNFWREGRPKTLGDVRLVSP